MDPRSSTACAPPEAPSPCTTVGCVELAIAGGLCDEHLLIGAPIFSDDVIGCTQPRLFTAPLRPLTRATTRGYEFIDFCELIGQPLLPYQKWLAIHALELRPDGTYRFRVVLVLIARQNGKSTFKRLLSLWRMYMDGAQLVLGVAQDVSLAREQWNLCQQTIHASPDLEEEWDCVRRVNGDEWFRIASGARYKIAASNAKAGRGLAVDELNIDELRTQQNWDAWSSVSKTTSARPYSQTWAMSNAGDERSVVLNQLRAAALSAADDSLGLFEWSGPDDCDLDDPQAWAQANPSLGYAMNIQAIRTALATDPPAVFRAEVLCQGVDQLDGPINLTAWKAQADPRGTMDSLRDRLAACVQVSEDTLHVTLAVAARTGDGRVRVEIVRAWPGTDAARLGNSAKDQPTLVEMLDRIKAQREGWFPTGPGAVFAPLLRGRARSHEIKGTAVTEASQGLADLTTARRLIHFDDPLVNTQITGARKKPSGDGWRFDRSAGHVDAVEAVAGAVHVALTMPEPARPRVRMIS